MFQCWRYGGCIYNCNTTGFHNCGSFYINFINSKVEEKIIKCFKRNRDEYPEYLKLIKTHYNPGYRK